MRCLTGLEGCGCTGIDVYVNKDYVLANSNSWFKHLKARKYMDDNFIMWAVLEMYFGFGTVAISALTLSKIVSAAYQSSNDSAVQTLRDRMKKFSWLTSR